jgi:hypothetical protein
MTNTEMRWDGRFFSLAFLFGLLLLQEGYMHVYSKRQGRVGVE